MKGFRQKTNEDIASEGLFDFFSDEPNCIVHSWHPPDGKAYFTLLLQIPSREEKKDKNSGRDHIDLIVQLGEYLILLEVKGKLSESGDDYAKLKRICNNFSVDELVNRFKQQGANFKVRPTKYAMGIGVREVNDSIPDDFAVFQFNNGSVQFHGKEAMKIYQLLKNI